MKTTALCAFALVGFATAECPNSCSGHGDCEAYDQCLCQTEGVVINPAGNIFKTQADDGVQPTKMAAWTGADCSQMTCPRGISWTDAAKDSYSGSSNYCEHKLSVECSDKGLCDRSTGQCTCFPGYTGAACQRTQCPNECSGHGICQSNVKFAQDATILIDPSLYAEYGFNADFDYLVSYDRAWDSGLHFGCKCDIGYRGPDCSLVECPSDDDPLDDFCAGGRAGLGYVEFVGAEYYFAAEEGSLDPQEAPLPNHMLLFVEDYESTTVTGTNNFCQITQNGKYTLTDGSSLGANYKDSNSPQSDNNGVSARARSGVVEAGNAGTGSAQKLQQQHSGTDSATRPTGGLQLCDDCTVGGFYNGQQSDCVNGVFCGGRTYGEPCSGRGLCNYADGTCQCHTGYVGNACQNVDALS